MEVELIEKKKKEKMDKEDMLVTEYASTYKGSSGAGYSEVTVKIILSSEDKAAPDMFGVYNIGEKQNFTLKDITTLDDFVPHTTGEDNTEVVEHA